MRAVAERRYGDAKALIATGHVERASGAIYLAGFTIEILLKGRLLLRHPSLSAIPLNSPALTKNEARLRDLIFRFHDLPGLLDALPEVQDAIKVAGHRAHKPYFEWLKSICSTWTVLARYSSEQTTLQEAIVFIDRVKVLKELLK